MANRHLARSIVLQSLFEWDFNGRDNKKIDEILERNINDHPFGLKDPSFIYSLARNIISKQKTLDDIIEKAAPDWPIDRIAAIDRNILRLGLYELLFGDRAEVPPKVAINEAIELAKTFGGENSGKFVNGVLGAVYKEMGEPGKDEKSKLKVKEPIDRSKLPLEKLVGAIVYARRGRELYLALVHDVFGHWTLSKGHLKDNEDELSGVRRKIKEELGIDAIPKEKIGENEYLANDNDKGKIRKHVSYYLAEAKLLDLKAEEGGGLDGARWFRPKEIVDLNIYDDILPLIKKAVKILANE